MFALQQRYFSSTHRKATLLLMAAVSCWTSGASAQQQPRLVTAQLINGLENLQDFPAFNASAQNGTPAPSLEEISAPASGVTLGHRALKITYQSAGSYPSAGITFPSTRDWSQADALAIDCTNTGSSITVRFTVETASGQRYGDLTVLAYHSGTFYFPLRTNTLVPTPAGAAVIPVLGQDTNFNLTAVRKFRLFINSSSSAQKELIVDNVRLATVGTGITTARIINAVDHQNDFDALTSSKDSNNNDEAVRTQVTSPHAGVTLGNKAQHVNFRVNTSYPGITQIIPNANENWSNVGNFAIDLHNPSNATIQLRLAIENDNYAGRSGNVTLSPLQSITAIIPLGPRPNSSTPPIDPSPLPANATSISTVDYPSGSNVPFDITRIRHYRLFINQPVNNADTLLVFDNVRLISDSRLIESFEAPNGGPTGGAIGANYVTNQGYVSGKGVTDGNYAWKVRYDANQHWRNAFENLSVTGGIDGSRFSAMACDITVTSNLTADLPIHLSVHNVHGYGAPCVDGDTFLPAGTLAYTTRTIILPFQKLIAANYGMTGLPIPLNYRVTSTLNQDFSSQQIKRWSLNLPMGAPSNVTLLIDNIRLMDLPQDNLVDIFDRYGQYNGDTWQGKVYDDNQLTTETLAPFTPGTNEQRDVYGGWTGKYLMSSSGFFEVIKNNNRWWFVDPLGNAFFSTGFNKMIPGSGRTKVQPVYRNAMFVWLPSGSDPLTAHYSNNNQDYNFYGANLQRKWGSNWNLNSDANNPGTVGYYSRARARMKAWGFNTVGNWSDIAITAPAGVTTKSLVYTANSSLPATEISEVTYPNGRINDNMPDPFHPNYRGWVKSSLSALITQVKDDPWCLGYFFDNEMDWGHGGYAPEENADQDRKHYRLVYQVLNKSCVSSNRYIASNAKTHFRDIILKPRYPGPNGAQDCSDAWGLARGTAAAFTTWAEFSEAFEIPIPSTGAWTTAARRTDFSDFLTAHAAKYFSEVSNAIRTAEPADTNHLYLGCRFASFMFTKEAITAADMSSGVDVITFNLYHPDLSAAQWPFLDPANGIQNKPVMLSEFSAAAIDAGHFSHGVAIPAADQMDRAKIFESMTRQALQNPLFIGYHWYEYVDQPASGIPWNGENSNNGFVSIADKVHGNIADMAKKVHQDMYITRDSG